VRTKRPIVVSLLAAVVLAVAAMSTASAAYPGANGRLAFGVLGPSGVAIVTVRPDGLGLRTLTSGVKFHGCAAYSPNGTWIAYCSNAGGKLEIWAMRQNGTDQHPVTNLGGRATFPDYSPDGRRIAFGGPEPGDPASEVYVVDAATGGSLERLTSCTGHAAGCFNALPAWSPDGTKIAYIHGDGRDALGNGINEQVWVMNADGSGAHPLTAGAAPKDQLPDWSPDGTKLAYASGVLGSGGIWVMNADGSGQHQLTGCTSGAPAPCAGGDDFGPTWSPDGHEIAFARDFAAVGGDRPIVVMNSDGSDQHRITASGVVAYAPAWQPRIDEGGD
jgi:Tol biopolymer transport system component